ncbi:hypothetical protein QTO34_018201 [Cnephaeus nilssonii]|uniref:Serpin domain-containing protein n=1 Tax=Cnephaeus nilssonii TaxID=3371016 RepID=A0AA40LPZ2_CNENI|nr:hypothetical protein QTO34_018201 [Eptesicus nilssonii]
MAAGRGIVPLGCVPSQAETPAQADTAERSWCGGTGASELDNLHCEGWADWGTPAGMRGLGAAILWPWAPPFLSRSDAATNANRVESHSTSKCKRLTEMILGKLQGPGAPVCSPLEEQSPEQMVFPGGHGPPRLHKEVKARVLELPSGGEELSMLILLPKHNVDLSQVRKELFLTNVVHKSFLEVNEEGTEATAASDMDMAISYCGVHRKKPRAAEGSKAVEKQASQGEEKGGAEAGPGEKEVEQAGWGEGRRAGGLEEKARRGQGRRKESGLAEKEKSRGLAENAGQGTREESRQGGVPRLAAALGDGGQGASSVLQLQVLAPRTAGPQPATGAGAQDRRVGGFSISRAAASLRYGGPVSPSPPGRRGEGGFSSWLRLGITGQAASSSPRSQPASGAEARFLILPQEVGQADLRFLLLAAAWDHRAGGFFVSWAAASLRHWHLVSCLPQDVG